MTIIDPPGRGWFAIAGSQAGERTLEQQLRGPDILLPEAPGRSVLDLACAEALIGLEFLKAGAVLLHGVERVESRLVRARELTKGRSAAFFAADLERFASAPPVGLLPAYDIVLVLSIAHKLKDPVAFIEAAAQRAGEAIAIRLPEPVISDRRSRFQKVDVPALMGRLGFTPIALRRGHLDEWCGAWRRCR